MAMIGDITNFEVDHKYNFDGREKYCREILNKCFGDNSSPDLYKLDFLLSNTCFNGAVESFLYNQFDGSILMLRNSLDAALFHAYCYKPNWKEKVAMSYTPNENYYEYAKGRHWNKKGYDAAIEFLDMNTDKEGILSLIRELDFSAHIAERSAKEFSDWHKLSQKEKDEKGWRIRTLAEEADVKRVMEKAVDYLKKIRDAYFVKFPPK